MSSGNESSVSIKKSYIARHKFDSIRAHGVQLAITRALNQWASGYKWLQVVTNSHK